jgi:hypothetical protein
LALAAARSFNWPPTCWKRHLIASVGTTDAPNQPHLAFHPPDRHNYYTHHVREREKSQNFASAAQRQISDGDTPRRLFLSRVSFFPRRRFRANKILNSIHFFYRQAPTFRNSGDRQNHCAKLITEWTFWLQFERVAASILIKCWSNASD